MHIDLMLLLTSPFSGSKADLEKWSKGFVTATAQNFARELMETPSNLMTPTKFVEAVSHQLGEVRVSSEGKLEVVPMYPRSYFHGSLL